jgi:hypothetical protein
MLKAKPIDIKDKPMKGICPRCANGFQRKVPQQRYCSETCRKGRDIRKYG